MVIAVDIGGDAVTRFVGNGVHVLRGAVESAGAVGVEEDVDGGVILGDADYVDIGIACAKINGVPGELIN